MDISIKNFSEEFPNICKTIESASFFAIDGEFTGLQHWLTSEQNIYPFDSPEEVYLKTTENSLDFIIVQLGLAAFKVEEDGKVTYKCYNFYAYPASRTAVFSCQGESMRFLSDNGFDFNKLFREGISYCNAAEEEKLRHDLKERQNYRAEQNLARENSSSDLSVDQVPVPEEEEKLIEECSDKIEKFLESDDTEIILNGNGFQRKLIYQLIDMKFSSTVSTSSVTLENNFKAIKVTRKRTKEEEEELEIERMKKEDEDLTKAIGLSLVLKELSKSKKLIIGHNMLLDLLHIIKQFFHPLPQNFDEFKKDVKKIFPLLLDTKYMSCTPTLKPLINSSVLQHLFACIRQEPFGLPKVECEDKACEYSADIPKEHEAGYDAYLTGLSFLAMAKHLQADLNHLTKCPQMKGIMNKIFLLRVQDVNYINMSGKEPTVPRDHVFYITFPETWKHSDIIAKFKNFGPVYVTWINNMSAFISLHHRENASCVIKTIGHHSGFQIMTFNVYKTKQQAIRRKRKLLSEGNESKEEEKEESKEESQASLAISPSAANKKRKRQNDQFHTFRENHDW